MVTVDTLVFVVSTLLWLPAGMVMLKHRKHPFIRATSPVLMILCILGPTVTYMLRSIVSESPPDTFRHHCPLVEGLQSLFGSMFVTALLVKQYRLVRALSNHGSGCWSNCGPVEDMLPWHWQYLLLTLPWIGLFVVLVAARASQFDDSIGDCRINNEGILLVFSCMAGLSMMMVLGFAIRAAMLLRRGKRFIQQTLGSAATTLYERLDEGRAAVLFGFACFLAMITFPLTGSIAKVIVAVPPHTAFWGVVLRPLMRLLSSKTARTSTKASVEVPMSASRPDDRAASESA